MGSEVDLVVLDGPAAAVADARDLVTHLERAWSRFLPTSEVSRLNRAGGEWVPVGPDTVALLRLMQDGYRASGGLFDPTTLPALEAAGYDRSVAWPTPDGPVASPDLPVRLDGRSGDGAASGPAPGLGSLRVSGHRARIDAGVRVDPGACGKGLAADRVAAAVLAAGAAGVLVSVGGDVAVAGTAPDARGWGVRVTGPRDRDVALLAVTGGGIATSATWRRRWRHGDGTVAHHVIDPRTGQPATCPVVQATVLAESAAWAEVVATAVLVGGADATSAVGDLPAVVIAQSGEVRLQGGVEQWMR
jgi:thiamine biosynthesis lipoprotein